MNYEFSQGDESSSGGGCCPVCDRVYQQEIPEYCLTCGWNLSAFPELMDESERGLIWEREQIHLHWARQIWQSYQAVFAEFYFDSQKSSSLPTQSGAKLKKSSVQKSKKSLKKRLNRLESQVERELHEISGLLAEIRVNSDQSLGLILQKLEGGLTSSSQQEVWSDVGMDYQPLMKLLSSEKWQKADEKTWEILLQIGWKEEQGWLSHEEINLLPITDLRTIDYLWQYYSQGHFGLAVQYQIWKSVNDDYTKFCDLVGWREQDNTWKYYEELSFNLKSPPGHLPILAWRKRSCYGIGSKMAADLFMIWMEKWLSCVHF